MMLKLKDDQLPLSLGPPVGLVKLFYCLCFLAYFNEDVLFWKEQQQFPRLRMHSFRAELHVKTVGFQCEC